MKPSKTFVLLMIAVVTICGCKKYLEAKSDQSLSTINNLADLQSLLDNYNIVNFSTVSADIVSGDDYYLTYADYQALDFEQQRNMYTWQPTDHFYPYTNQANDWNSVYNNVYLANTVLDNLDKVQIDPTNAITWNSIKGQALFLRSYNLYKALTIWSLAYDSSTSGADLGVPLRLNSDFNQPSQRSSVTQSYDQITTDTKMAVSLLPVSAKHVYRSSKAAAFALLSRIYLAMREYEKAGLYADSCLQLKSQLLDYNKLSATAAYPLPKFNDEIIYDTNVGGTGATPITRTKARIDSNLIATYAPNDLRLTAFYTSSADGAKLFRGSYEGASTRFNGIATDEMYLTRAECFARNGKVNEAMADLNLLLKNRFKTGSFTPVSAINTTDALTKILLERRKELVMRGGRWIDIKRFNKDGAAISLKRFLNGKVYELNPNELRYALPIPNDVISLSGIQQNPR